MDTRDTYLVGDMYQLYRFITRVLWTQETRTLSETCISSTGLSPVFYGHKRHVPCRRHVSALRVYHPCSMDTRDTYLVGDMYQLYGFITRVLWTQETRTLSVTCISSTGLSPVFYGHKRHVPCR